MSCLKTSRLHRTLPAMLRTSAHHPCPLGSSYPCAARLLRLGSTERARGYQLEQFVELWQTHFGFTVPGPQPPSAASSQSDVTLAKQSEIANKDKGCHAVTDSRAVSVVAPRRPAATAKLNPETANQVEEVPPDLRIQPHTIPLGQSGVTAFS